MKISELPQINFATADPQELLSEAISIVEDILGRKIERADPLRLFLNGLIAIIINQRLLIDQTAKMNLLAFATGDYLDHLGALTGTTRLPATYATTTIKIELSTERLTSTVIKQGTRISADDETYFALDEDVIIPAGDTTATAKATCTVIGTVGNGSKNFVAGELAAFKQDVHVDITGRRRVNSHVAD